MLKALRQREFVSLWERENSCEAGVGMGVAWREKKLENKVEARLFYALICLYSEGQ